MEIKETLSQYQKKKSYFEPDYKRENKILTAFKKKYDQLEEQHVIFLKNILINPASSWPKKYFVADLLYLYESFSELLLEPLLTTAINYKDPSFNRIFLKPCLQAIGKKPVIAKLIEKFEKGSLVERLGIANLIYWLKPGYAIVFGDQASSWELELPKREIDPLLQPLYMKVSTRALETDHIIELYFYKLNLTKEEEIEEYTSDFESIVTKVFRKFKDVPEGATALVKRIQGQEELEDILYDQLDWHKD